MVNTIRGTCVFVEESVLYALMVTSIIESKKVLFFVDNSS